MEEKKMQLKNTTDWSDWFLRRMLSWACKQAELPVRQLKKARFTKCTRSFRGRAWYSEILVRVGPEDQYPVKFVRHSNAGRVEHDIQDPVEGLIYVAVHECVHIWQGQKPKRWQEIERHADRIGMQGVLEFRANRDSLLTKWMETPTRAAATTSPKVSVVARRAANAKAKLKIWERKAKLSEKKVRYWRKKVQYYD